MKPIVKYILLIIIPLGFIPLVDVIFESPGNVFTDYSFALAVTISIGLIILFLDSFLNFSIPDQYYLIRNFEKNGTPYLRLGIRGAQQLLRKAQTVKFSGRRTDISKLIKDTKIAEKHHFLAFLGVSILIVYSLLNMEWLFASGLLFFNILLQAYPVMLQRYNRSRIRKLKHNALRAGAPTSPSPH